MRVVSPIDVNGVSSGHDGHQWRVAPSGLWPDIMTSTILHAVVYQHAWSNVARHHRAPSGELRVFVTSARPRYLLKSVDSWIIFSPAVGRDVAILWRASHMCDGIVTRVISFEGLRSYYAWSRSSCVGNHPLIYWDSSDVVRNVAVGNN